MRILVVKLRHIGDVLMMTPMLRALKDSYPDAGITAVIPRGMEDILSFNPCVTKVIPFKKGSGIIEDLRLLMTLRAARFDIAINMTEGDRGAIMCFASGAGKRIGADPLGRGFPGKGKLFTDLVPQKWDRHRALMDMEMIRPLGIEPGGQRLELHTSRENDGRVLDMLAGRGIKDGARIAVVHPTSRWLFKCWNDKSVADVIDYLHDRGFNVILTSGPDKKETDKARAVAGLAKRKPVDFSGLLTLGQLASLLKRSGLFFGVDSAPMHMAAAVGTPVVALFGPSDYKVWGPYTDKARVIVKKDEYPCIPCRKDGCGGSKKSDCLEAITVPEVIRAIEEIIET